MNHPQPNTVHRRYSTNTPKRAAAKVVPLHADWRLYEELKARYTANATSQAEYDAGIRRAVEESGV